MKLALFVGLALLGLVSCDTRVPTFNWQKEGFSPEGVPLLTVNFHDGKPSDVVIFKQLNPIARQASESEDKIDRCIFAGFLRDESTAYVVLTGGCPFEDSFEITIRSSRLTEHMFKSVEGQVSIVPSIYKSKGLIHDIALKPPVLRKTSIKNPKAPENGYVMAVALNYDATFLSQFGEDGYNVMRRAAAHAQALYNHPTLGYPIEWVITGSIAIPDSIQADEGYLTKVGEYNAAGPNSNVYFCYQNNEAGTVGIAWVGTICGPLTYQTAVVEYFNNDINTGEILAHEVGHNLGMEHDFVGAPGNNRYDSQGRLCTGIGGVMDYYGEVFQWSTCSVEDFNNTPHSCLGSP